MSARVDNFCVGKHQLNKADLAEIGKCLVGEEWRIQLAPGRGNLQIFFAHGPVVAGREPFE